MLTTDFVTGAPNWLDLGSPDIDAATAFYGAVFGWTFQSAGPEAGGYGFFQQDGRTVAAIGPLTEDGASSAWTVYFKAPDADATAKAVEQGGGQVRVEPFDVMEAGRMACLSDPSGADFAIWQPAAVQGLDLVNETGSLCWAELHTTDPAAAQTFYQALFGWRSKEVEMPGLTYTVVAPAEGADQDKASFGGLVPTMGEDETSRWVPYFETEDVDALVALVQESGGSVLMPAADIPAVGRMAHLTDPFGAPFAVIKSAV